MKLRQLLNAQAALQVLAAADLPVRAAYKLARVIPSMDEEFKVFDTMRTNIAKKHGTPNETGEQIQVPTENMPAFTSEIESILDTELNLPHLPRFTLDDLGEIKLTAVQMMTLQDVVIFDTPA